MVQAASRATCRQRRSLLSGLRATLDPALAILEVIDLLLDPVGGRVELEGLFPRGQGVVVVTVLDERVAQVLVDHGIRLLGLHDGALELLECLRILALLVVRPAEAVDEVAVLGLEIECLADQLDRLVEVRPALGVHVADVVVRLGVLGIERDHAIERLDRVVEARLLLVDDAELEVQVLLLLVEAQTLLERLDRAVVLLGAVVRGAEVEEELGPLGLHVDGFAKGRDRFVVALGPAVEEPELHARVDRPRVGAQDALELGLGLGVAVGVHVRGREEVAGAEIPRLERDDAAERVDRLVPHLLLVVDGAELHPRARVLGRGVGEPFELGLRFRQASQADQEVGQLVGEGRVVRVGLDRTPVDLDRFLVLVQRLAVDGAERAPGPVVIGVELDSGGESRDRLVPVLGLDRETAEEELRLGQSRLLLDQPQQHGACLVVLLLLDVDASQGQVRLLGARAQLDRALELGLGLGNLALRAQKLRQGHVGRDLVGGELDGAAGRGHGLVDAVGAHEQLGQLRPEGGRVWILLDRGLHVRNRVLEAASLHVHLRDGVRVVRVAAGIGGGHDAAGDLVVAGDRRLAHAGTARERARDDDHGQPGPGLRHHAARRRGHTRVWDGRRRFIDLAQRALVERRRGPRGSTRGRLGLDRARDEAERSNGVEAISETAGELVAAERQLVEPGGVVDGDGETPIGEAPSLGAASGVGADHLRPGPADPVLEQSVTQVRDRSEQQISDGARRSAVHALVSYILRTAGRESG